MHIKYIFSQVTELSGETPRGETVKITVTLTRELPASSPVCTQVFNIIFRKWGASHGSLVEASDAVQYRAWVWRVEAILGAMCQQQCHFPMLSQSCAMMGPAVRHSLSLAPTSSSSALWVGTKNSRVVVSQWCWGGLGWGRGGGGAAFLSLLFLHPLPPSDPDWKIRYVRVSQLKDLLFS